MQGPQVRRSRFKRTAHAVIFILRIRLVEKIFRVKVLISPSSRISEQWRRETAMRPQVLAALEDVRRRRALAVIEN